MFRKSNANKIVFFLVSLRYREIITIKAVILSLNVLKEVKEGDTNFVLLCQWRNMIGQFKKRLYALTNQDSTFSHTC